MKRLTQVVLESGLLDKTTAALMERWGFLWPGASELTPVENTPFCITTVLDPTKGYIENKNNIKKALEDFVEELELLLQPEAIERSVVELDNPDKAAAFNYLNKGK